jgi:hypothetical protein
MNKTMLVAALAALAVGSASAETIYITGSTAFRKAANVALTNAILGDSGSLLATDTGGTDAGNLVFKTKDNDYVVVYWSGSEAGIQSVAGPSTNGYRAPYVGSITTNPAVTNTLTYAANGNSTNYPVSWTNGTLSRTGTGTNTVVKQVFASYKTTNMITDTIASQPNKLPFWDPAKDYSAATGTWKAFTYSGNKVTNIAHIAFSDTYQASSAFGGGKTVAFFATNNLADSETNGIKAKTNQVVLCASNTYDTIANDIRVGVVGFGFVCSANGAIKNAGSFDGTSSGIANITQKQAAALFKLGKVNAAQFTGSLDDTNRFVYAVGRSVDSGTRLVTFSLLGLGSTVTNNSVASGVNSGINQYLILGTNTGVKYSSYTDSIGRVYASNTSSTLVITNWPAEVTVGKLCAKGHNGYASGGDLCTTIAAVTSANSPGNAIAIGYAGLADAQGKSANILAYEGVYPSTGAIKSGSYPFWSYEHIFTRNDISVTGSNLATTIATFLTGTNMTTASLQTYAKGTLRLADVTNNLTRSTDGGAIAKSWTNSVVVTNLPSYSATAKQATAGLGAGF